MNLEITKEELEVLFTILYQGVGGDPDGPRKHASSLLEKVDDLMCGPSKFKLRYGMNRFAEQDHPLSELQERALRVEIEEVE